MKRAPHAVRLMSSCASISVVALILPFTSIRSAAQTDLNEVHIQPDIASIPTDATRSPDITYKATSDLVLVPVSITDSMNRPVLGLSRDNFNVYENKEIQSILHVSSEDSPVSIGILVDTSESMQHKLETVTEAANTFIRTANPKDEFFLLEFGTSVHQTVDFTSSMDQLSSNLESIVPEGRTALLDAIYIGLTKMKEAKYPRKALFVLSDGGDNHSRHTETEVGRLVKELDVMIFAIGIYDHHLFASQEELSGPDLLQSLAEATGGKSYTVHNSKDLANAALRIGTQLRRQYVLEYRPTHRPHDGKWHNVKVNLAMPKGFPHVYVSAKQGYYASPE